MYYTDAKVAVMAPEERASLVKIESLREPTAAWGPKGAEFVVCDDGTCWQLLYQSGSRWFTVVNMDTNFALSIKAPKDGMRIRRHAYYALMEMPADPEEAAKFK